MIRNALILTLKRFDYLLPESVAEAGFLFALFFGVLGPIPRYFGFLITIIGLFFRKAEIVPFLRGLPISVKISFSLLLIWGAINTALHVDSFFLWGKGWSLVFEFVFSVLAAAFVFRNTGAFERWRSYMVLLVIFMGGFTLWSFVINGKMEGFFSLHTFPSTITIPLFPLIILSFFDGRGKWRGNILHFMALFLLITMFLIGLSSGALVSNMVALISLLLLFRPSRKSAMFFMTALVLAGVCLFIILPLSRYCPSVQNTIRSEIGQLSALSDPAKFTSKRNQIWEAAFFLAKRHPGGIGWNHFEKKKKKYIQEKQLIRKQPSNQIHNEYLTLLVEGGIPSLLAYLLFLWGCLTVLYSLRKKKDSLKVALLGSTFAGILVFALIGGIFDERQVLAVYFWTIFGAIISQNEGMLSIGGETGHGIP